MLDLLVKLADMLDQRGHRKAADVVDELIVEAGKRHKEDKPRSHRVPSSTLPEPSDFKSRAPISDKPKIRDWNWKPSKPGEAYDPRTGIPIERSKEEAAKVKKILKRRMPSGKQEPFVGSGTLGEKDRFEGRDFNPMSLGPEKAKHPVEPAPFDIKKDRPKTTFETEELEGPEEELHILETPRKGKEEELQREERKVLRELENIFK